MLVIILNNYITSEVLRTTSLVVHSHLFTNSSWATNLQCLLDKTQYYFRVISLRIHDTLCFSSAFILHKRLR